MASDLQQTLKHTSIYGITNIMKKGAAFFMIPVYTHYLSPSDYGTLELLELILDVTTLLAGLRIGEAVVRYYHHFETEDEKTLVFSTAFWFSVVMTLLTVAACQGLVPYISKLVFNGPSHQGFLSWIFICLGCQLLFIVPETVLMVRKKSVLYSAISFVSFLLALSLNIYFLVVLKLGIWGMIYSMVITKAAYLLFLVAAVLPRMKFKFSWDMLKKMVWFGLPLIPGVLSLFVLNFSDRFFIQQFTGAHDLGIYSLGYKFGILLVVLITDPFSRIWNTQRYEVAASPLGNVTIGRYFTYYLAALISLALALCVFSDPIISLVADQRFQDAALIVPLIAASYIFQGLAGFTTIGVMVTYNTRFILLTNLLTAILNLGLNYLLIRHWGIMGAAVSTILSYGFLFVVTTLISQRFFPICFEWRRLAKLMGITILVLVLWRLVSHQDVFAMVFRIAVFLIFPLGLIKTRFFTPDESARLKKLLSLKWA